MPYRQNAPECRKAYNPSQPARRTKVREANPNGSAHDNYQNQADQEPHTHVAIFPFLGLALNHCRSSASSFAKLLQNEFHRFFIFATMGSTPIIYSYCRSGGIAGFFNAIHDLPRCCQGNLAIDGEAGFVAFRDE